MDRADAIAAFNADQPTRLAAMGASRRGDYRRLIRKLEALKCRCKALQVTYRTGLARPARIPREKWAEMKRNMQTSPGGLPSLMDFLTPHLCPRRFRYWRRIKMYDQKAIRILARLEAMTPGVQALMMRMS